MSARATTRATWPTRLGRVLAGLALTAGVAVVPAVPAEAAGPGPTVHLAGRGWGHGIGMSQWGAYGAATAGLTWARILAFYYPGTAQATGWDRYAIRVQLSPMRGTPTAVRPASGLLVDTGGCTEALPVSTDTTGWRAARSGSSWVLQRRSVLAGGWVGATSTCPVAGAADITFRNSSHASTAAVTVITATGATRDYRGWVSTALSGSTLETVNVVMLDDYVASVVPGEMPASWHPEALAAQAVAARTYAAARLGSSGAWDICDTTACQVYPGRSSEQASSTAAVTATSGLVLTSSGAPITAMFSSYNGGQTAAANAPYLIAQPDPYEARFATPSATWHVEVPASSLEAKWPAIGLFRELRTQRDGAGRWGGRVTSVTLVGTAGTVTVSGGSFQSAFGLRSTYFAPESVDVGADIPATGFTDVVARDSAGTVWVYPGNGRAGWLARRQLATTNGVRQVLSPGDMTGDGLDDVLLVTTGGYLDLLPALPDGTLGPARRIGSGWGTYSELTAPGDMTGDGFPDLLARDSSGVVWIYRADGTGGWLGRTKVSSGWGSLRRFTAVGDFSGQGRIGLTVVDAQGGLRLYTFSSSGTWVGSTRIGWGWSTFTAFAGPGDFDGDGNPDLLARDAAGALQLYRGNGTGGWLPRVRVGSGWNSMADITS
ncbi:SpoIID/LytB domain-containing protein [Phycicoccus sp.]|uniref:SpoIID/LytB domain-containing protein n=1 Tax=Phycicoccus sp. TaxID=1902410 RepID=UPI002C16854D|nr:SpoIID/LytB domain-containing protein [Phycicoccus sp.]HMM95717.1 SpoIID/LytB domain-containing protein [Phycicoccus sp.]